MFPFYDLLRHFPSGKCKCDLNKSLAPSGAQHDMAARLEEKVPATCQRPVRGSYRE